MFVCISIQQQRGHDVSTETWEAAIKTAEGLVLLADKKLERQRNAYGTRMARLAVGLD